MTLQRGLSCLFFILTSIYVDLVISLGEGDSCSTKDREHEVLPGVCRNVTNCQYAIQLIHNYVKPTHCAHHKNGDEVVCCPLSDSLHRTGQFRDAFGDTQDGVIRSKDTVCWYDGNLPFKCCEDKPNGELKPEPVGCPLLEKPKREVQEPWDGVWGGFSAWRKCVEFQRFVSVCEQVDGNSKLYKRRDACGMNGLADKIFGGVEAIDKEFPHMALLGCRKEVKSDPLIEWVGGGTLISDRYILTAAHVISHPVYGLVRYVLLGVLAKSASREGVLHNVLRHHIHKFYSPKEKYHDIALLQLDTRVIFSDFIRPACLSTPGMKYSNTRIVAGWGRTKFEESSDKLMKTDIREFPSSVCSRSIDNQGLSRGWDAEAMICAGGYRGQANDSCPGDSGGPLMVYMEDLPCSYAVRGIVSWGSQCGQGSPGVYTNVEKYLEWITDEVWPIPSKEAYRGQGHRRGG